MSYEEETEGQVTSLVAQLGSAPKKMANDEWDIRLLSYIIDPENIPSSYRSILYALVRRDVVIHKKRFWDALADNHLVLLNSIKGRGRNDQIRAEGAIKGILPPMEAPAEQPTLRDRLLNTERMKEYREYQERKELGLE